MKRQLKGEKGITLVELLAVLVISSIVIVLIMSVFSTGQNEHSRQTTKAEQLNDVRYAAKVITKELRKAEVVKSADNILELGKETPIIFKLQNDVILKNGVPLISGVSLFEVTPTMPSSDPSESPNQKLEIKIESTVENESKQTIETEIYIREGVSIE